MACFNDLSQEVVGMILKVFVETTPLRYVVLAKAVSRTFYRIIDPLIWKHGKHFGNRVVDHHNKSVLSTYQHYYDRRGIFSLNIAITLIENEWDNRSVVHSRFKEFLELVEDKVHEHDDAGTEDHGAFRKRMCSWLARVNHIHINPRDSRQLVYEYTDCLVMRLARLRLFSDSSTDFNTREQEILALAMVMCDVETLKSFIATGISFIWDMEYFLTREADGLPYWETTDRIRHYFGSPLEMVAMCGFTDHLKLLLEQLDKVFDLSTHWIYLSSSFQLASTYGHLDEVKQIKNFINRHGVPKTKSNYATIDAFKAACTNNHLDIAQELQGNLPSSTLLSDLNDSLRACVAMGCHSSTIRYLVTCGAQLNHVATNSLDETSHTPLMMAIRYGHKHLVRTLVELGSKSNQKDLWRGCFWPIYWDDIDMLELLLSIGVKIYHDEKSYSVQEFNLQTNDEFVFLAGLPVASHRRSFKAVKFLLKNYPQVMKTKQPALAIANTSKHDDLEMTKLLFAHGADVKNRKGAHAVFMATTAGNQALLQLLLDHGASTDVQYWYGLRRPNQPIPSRYRRMSALGAALYQVENTDMDPDEKAKFHDIIGLLSSYGAKVKADDARSGSIYLRGGRPNSRV